ncbi:MAG: hypothetical protein JRJ87_15765 [Deltaproteobacteria bacterium]|nr:hypothetical protein [Deltaproteobacteria bacterium]
MKCATEKELLQHLANSLPGQQAELLEQHLTSCQHCSKAHAEFAAMTRRLAPDSGEFDDPELVDDVMTLVRLGRANPERLSPAKPVRRAWLLAGSAACLSAALVFFLWPAATQDESTRIRTRGGLSSDTDRWVSLKVLRATEEGYQQVSRKISSDDALAFVYDNRLESQHDYLMVLGVSERGRVYWYYPAYQQAGQNPQSIRIEKSKWSVQLPDQVRHQLNPGRLRIFALFTRQALDVEMVESIIKRDLEKQGSLAQLERLNIEGTAQQSFLLDVE